MSKSRIQDLRNALERAGWVVSSATDDLLTINNEVISWNLFNSNGDRCIELQFHLFGDLGQRSSNLNDVLYCVVRENGQKMYFEKQSTNEWKSSVAMFVESLARIDQCNSTDEQ